MDVPGEMMTLALEGELAPSPVVRVNKPGNLMAVSTANSSLKILANTEGTKMLHAKEPAAAAPSSRCVSQDLQSVRACVAPPVPATS
jgi:hypothetical protein